MVLFKLYISLESLELVNKFFFTFLQIGVEKLAFIKKGFKSENRVFYMLIIITAYF